MGRHYSYGQVVVGPCGSGKTTYCNGMQQYLELLNRKNVVVINLDPANYYYCNIGNDNNDQSSSEDVESNDSTSPSKANSALPYRAMYDVCVDAVNVQSVMEKLRLGPNGGLMYCMEYIEAHILEMIDTIQSRTATISTTQSSFYYIFDCPGQVELYTHSSCIQNILQTLSKALHIQLTVVQLIDALYCSDVTKFISASLLGTTTMIRLELPTINVLSKVDLLTTNNDELVSSSLPFQLDYYTECYDLQRLIPFLYETNFNNDNDDIFNKDGNDSTTYNIEDDISNDVQYQKAVQKRNNAKFAKQYQQLQSCLAEIIEDYSLLSYTKLNINDAESVGELLQKIDRANGYYDNTSTE